MSVITSASVTSGEKDDGSQMQALIDRSRDNLKDSKEKGVTVVAKLNRNVVSHKNDDGVREKYRTRYKIEAKNSDLKNNYGYGRAESYGLQAT